MFQLTNQELIHLKSQFATSRFGWGGRRTPPFAFTEHGTVMVANLLNSQQDVQASVFVVRAFIKMRELLGQQGELSHKLTQLENKISGHDEDIKAIVAAIRSLTAPPLVKQRKIGGKVTHFLVKGV